MYSFELDSRYPNGKENVYSRITTGKDKYGGTLASTISGGTMYTRDDILKLVERWKRGESLSESERGAIQTLYQNMV